MALSNQVSLLMFQSSRIFSLSFLCIVLPVPTINNGPTKISVVSGRCSDSVSVQFLFPLNSFLLWGTVYCYLLPRHFLLLPAIWKVGFLGQGVKPKTQALIPTRCSGVDWEAKIALKRGPSQPCSPMERRRKKNRQLLMGI